MRKYLRDTIQTFDTETKPGFKMLGCYCGAIVTNKTVWDYKQITSHINKEQPYVTMHLNLNKLRSRGTKTTFALNGYDIIKVNKMWYSAFRIYALLKEMGCTNKSIVEIYTNTSNNPAWPILLKANNQEAVLAPHILDVDNTPQEELNAIPTIEQFGKVITPQECTA